MSKGYTMLEFLSEVQTRLARLVRHEGRDRHQELIDHLEFLIGVEQPRWHATVTYRHENGEFPKTFTVAEIEDLADLIEAGPHFDTIVKIEIGPISPLYPGLTVEEAEKM